MIEKAPRSGDKDSASEAWPSEVRSFLGPNTSLPQIWGPSRGSSASAATVSAQGMREAVSSHPSPSSILQSRVPGRGSAMAATLRQPAISADSTMAGKNGRLNPVGIACRCTERRQAAKPRTRSRPHRSPPAPRRQQASEGQRPAGDRRIFSAANVRAVTSHFAPSRRSPCQKFCSPACRQALRRVIERERRWRQRARRTRCATTGTAPAAGPELVVAYFPPRRPTLRFHCPPEGGRGGRVWDPSGPPVPFLQSSPGERAMNPYPVGQVCPVPLDQLGDQFRRYRLRVPQAVTAMAQSLRRWGQCAPIVATVRQERPQVLDGFTRWEAA